MADRRENHRGNEPHRDGRRPHHRRSRRGRLGRLFAHGDLRYLILKLIAENPRHGYEIIKDIEALVAGAYSPSPGVVYPSLTYLEEVEWIRQAPSEGSKILYEITPDGTLALEANRMIVEDILSRIAEVNEAQNDALLADAIPSLDASAPPQLRVALDDLKRAFERRLSGEPPTKEQLKAIAAALSRAATEIEDA